MEIKRPDWKTSILVSSVAHSTAGKNTIKNLDTWFDENVKPVNIILANGIEVTGFQRSGVPITFGNKWLSHDTHKGLLIDIQPIKENSKKEKAIKLLGELLQSKEDGDILGWSELHDKIEKAKTLLEGK